MYRENILDHYRHPHNQGLKADSSVQEVGYNPTCGDAVTVQLDIKDSCVTAMRHDGHGCAISVAAASMLSEAIKNKPVGEIMQTDLAEIQELLGTPLQAGRVKCGMLALCTVQQALRTVQAKTN